MADDIVSRLREAHSTFRVVVGVNQHLVFDSIHSEAADEIERLRQQLYLWKRAAHLSSLVFLKEGTAYDAWRAIQEAREHDAPNG